MSYHRRERIGSKDLLYPQRNAQEDQKGIIEVCRDGKEHVDSHIEKVMFSGHKEMTYHRRESLSPRERIGPQRRLMLEFNLSKTKSIKGKVAKQVLDDEILEESLGLFKKWEKSST